MEQTIKYIRSKIGKFRPDVAIILGSGLGSLADKYGKVFIPYKEIPNFPVSSVKGHKSQLAFGIISDKRVVMMQGRTHYYESGDLNKITYPIKVLKALGVKHIILTNAAGSVNKSFNPGDLMVITDHINFMGVNPLVGPNDERFGPRFPDMSEVYPKEFIKFADVAAKYLGIHLRHGVYIAMSGPSYETPAEINMARVMGADAVGMSTVPEAIVANYCSMNVLGISCISNYASGVSTKKLSHNEVIEVTNNINEKFQNLILQILKSDFPQ